jgi:hypothetical protein
MISHDEISKKFSDPTLWEEEKASLKKLEALTDKAIEVQYNQTRSIALNDDEVEKILSKHGIHRRMVVEKAWKDLYEKGGWKIESSSDQDSTWWYITPLKK